MALRTWLKYWICSFTCLADVLYNAVVSRRRYICLSFIMTVGHGLTAQDIHFSQFMSSPLNLNPAQTGNFDGAYRFTGNARRQWRSVTVPYQTIGVSADAKDFLRIKNVGTGISVYQDIAGDSYFSTLQMNLAGAYNFELKKNKHLLAVGVQSGITQRKLDYSKLSFDNQYDGTVYDPGLPSMESFQNDGRIYLNLNAGINWTHRIKDRKNIFSGIALFNINRPPQSFFGDEQIKLDRRLNFNVGSQWKLAKKFDLLPAALFMAQGTYRELVLGTSLKYILRDKGRYDYKAVYLGGWVRTEDAVFVSVGMDYDAWKVGLSYDINLSNLRPASHRRGGFELSVMYIIRDILPKRLKYMQCPDFM